MSPERHDHAIRIGRHRGEPRLERTRKARRIGGIVDELDIEPLERLLDPLISWPVTTIQAPRDEASSASAVSRIIGLPRIESSNLFDPMRRRLPAASTIARSSAALCGLALAFARRGPRAGFP